MLYLGAAVLTEDKDLELVFHAYSTTLVQKRTKIPYPRDMSGHAQPQQTLLLQPAASFTLQCRSSCS